MNRVHYFPGKAGEVSTGRADEAIAKILANPFTTGRLLKGIADGPYKTRRQSDAGMRIVAAGAMWAELQANALRWAVRGEGE